MTFFHAVCRHSWGDAMKFGAFLLSIILLACVAGSTAYSQPASPPMMLKQGPPEHWRE
jgi:hypothetical protein